MSDEETLRRALRDINAAKDLQGGNYPAKLHLATARDKILSVINGTEVGDDE